MSEQKELAVGVDVGGTNTVFGLVDRQGNIVAEGHIPTDGFGKDIDAYVAALCEGISALRNGVGFDYRLAGIGVGAPNANYYDGTIEYAANLPWKGMVIPFADKIRAFFPGIPVILTNDAKAAAVGEMVYGAAQGMTNFILITLGTGLGSGFVANGRIIYGHDSFAGEFGHCIVTPGGRECGCGLKGCLETYVSASGIVRTAFDVMALRRMPSALREVSYNNLTAKMVTEAAQSGDAVALETLTRTGETLGAALATAITITRPQAIFVFGGVARAGKLLFEPAKKAMEENLLANYKGKIDILPSALMDKNAAVLGASSLVWVAG